MRYKKYKKIYKVSLFGNNDEWRNRSQSQYTLPGSSLQNGKTCRFNLNGAFNDVILSKNARLILESAYFPSVLHCNAYVNVRIVTSSNDAVFDTVKQSLGNPLLVTFHAINQSIFNDSELLNGFNIPSTFLSKGYIDVEIESPITSVFAISFFGGALDRFILTFVIVDEDEEEIKDESLAAKVEYKNYGRLGMPIRTPLT